MITLLLSVVAAVAAFFAVAALMGTFAAWFPAVAAFIAAWILIGRRIGRRVQALSQQIEKHVTAGRTEQAVKLLEDLRRLGRWQFLLARALDGEIGVLLYAQKQDFERARPYLERAPAGNWRAALMLGAIHHRRKQPGEMERAFARAAARNKKTALVWATWAWCEWQLGRRDKAIEVLANGARQLPSDEGLKRNLLALQNLKKMKMNGFGAEWYALHLEKPPAMRVGGAAVPRWMGGGRQPGMR